MQMPSLQPRNLPRNRGHDRQFVLSKIDKEQGAEDREEVVAPALRILIADRDSMSSDSLAIALTKHGMCDALAVSSADMLRTLETHPADVAVIGSDIKLGSRNAFDLAHLVSETYSNVLIVMILNQPDRDSVLNAFRSGCRGVFSRNQPMTEFLDCVRHVHKGYIWAGGQEASCILDIFRNLPAPAPVITINSPSLTERELQVVRLAAQGKTNRAIANALSLSEHTVKNYLFRAFEKLGVSSRVELLFYLTVRGHSFAPAGEIGCS